MDRSASISKKSSGGNSPIFFSWFFGLPKDMKEMPSVEPVVVALFLGCCFTAYIKSKMEAGADLPHLNLHTRNHLMIN